MNFLDKIINFKKQEIIKIKNDVPIKKLVASPIFKRKPLSLKNSLTKNNSTGIIAEFKRQSPSKGIINDKHTLKDVINGYLKANVSGISILTDTKFFGGTISDLIEARNINLKKPILRKDFIIDGFQIVEAKAIGADVILLIVCCLSPIQLKNYSQLANDLGLEILYEVHSKEDLDKINDLDNKIIGINNRNLKTFEVDIDNSLKFAELIPLSSIKVSESGINKPNTVIELKKYGFKGFLIGEKFMKNSNPREACKKFIEQIL